MTRERLYWIDVAVTLLIMLVIAGHCYFSFQPEWYAAFHTWIYSFHMAAFFFISGFLVYYTYRPLQNFREYGVYIGRKIKKFGIPFVLLGIPLVFYAVFHKGGNGKDYADGLIKLFTDTMASPVIYLWFIYVLLEFYILAPLFCQFYHYSIGWGLLCAVFLLIFPLPRLFSLHMFSRYFIFFLLGMVICRFRNFFSNLPPWSYAIILIPFVSMGVLQIHMPEFFYSILALPCLYSISKVISDWGYGRRMFEKISKECYFIYLLQMIFVNLFALLIRDEKLSTLGFCIFMLSAILVAVAGSLIFAKIYHWIMNIFFSKKMVLCASRG